LAVLQCAEAVALHCDAVIDFFCIIQPIGNLFFSRPENQQKLPLHLGLSNTTSHLGYSICSNRLHLAVAMNDVA